MQPARSFSSVVVVGGGGGGECVVPVTESYLLDGHTHY